MPIYKSAHPAPASPQCFYCERDLSGAWGYHYTHEGIICFICEYSLKQLVDKTVSDIPLDDPLPPEDEEEREPGSMPNEPRTNFFNIDGIDFSEN